jgi:hypothetical protein
MATLYDSAAKERAGKRPPHTSVAPGIVKNNCDLVVQGKVLVRIPTLDQEVWARLTATGAGNGTGHFHVPNIDDEVLVALVHADPVDAYILGGMWSTTVSPPIAPVPTNVPTKRVIRTGLTAAVGHEIEFDDLLQTITITSAMPPGGVQRIKLEPTGITLTNLAGSITLAADPTNPTVSIALSGKAGIELSSEAFIKLGAPLISIEADGPCVISGSVVKIN